MTTNIDSEITVQTLCDGASELMLEVLEKQIGKKAERIEDRLYILYFLGRNKEAQKLARENYKRLCALHKDDCLPRRKMYEHYRSKRTAISEGVVKISETIYNESKRLVFGCDYYADVAAQYLELKELISSLCVKELYPLEDYLGNYFSDMLKLVIKQFAKEQSDISDKLKFRIAEKIAEHSHNTFIYQRIRPELEKIIQEVTGQLVNHLNSVIAHFQVVQQPKTKAESNGLSYNPETGAGMWKGYKYSMTTPERMIAFQMLYDAYNEEKPLVSGKQVMDRVEKECGIISKTFRDLFRPGREPLRDTLIIHAKNTSGKQGYYYLCPENDPPSS